MLLSILRFVRMIPTWMSYVANLQELSELGDHELAKIGITRSDIPRVAWEIANR